MIANTNGLSGVPVDVSDYYFFFTSSIGGHWNREEIDILRNPTLCCLYRKIDEIAEANYDYVITIFAGHGKEADDDTVLIINGRKEEIVLSDLMNLSQRQLIIADCCRYDVESFFDLSFAKEDATMLSMSRDTMRQAYEERIWGSMPQEVILYACDEGEAAMDTNEGHLYSYSQCLLNATQIMLMDSNAQFVSVGQVHRQAASLMRQDNPSWMQQRPQIVQPRCSLHQRLPWAVNVECFDNEPRRRPTCFCFSLSQSFNFG
jgi:hypothetical protein